MKKITYANEYTVLGNIIDENELTYTVEFEAAEGFMDTVTFEKELTVVEEIKEEKQTLETATFIYTLEEIEGKVVVKKFRKGGELERTYRINKDGKEAERLQSASKQKLPNKLLQMVASI